MVISIRVPPQFFFLFSLNFILHFHTHTYAHPYITLKKENNNNTVLNTAYNIQGAYNALNLFCLPANENEF